MVVQSFNKMNPGSQNFCAQSHTGKSNLFGASGAYCAGDGICKTCLCNNANVVYPTTNAPTTVASKSSGPIDPMLTPCTQLATSVCTQDKTPTELCIKELTAKCLINAKKMLII